MAPPLLARRGADGRPRKMRLGRWLLPAMNVLAKTRRLRGSWLDPFGHTAERKLERQLALDYETTIDELLGTLTQDNRALAVAVANVPERIRGYGHVKLANVATAKAQWRELLDRFHGRAPVAPAAEPIRVAVLDQRG